MQNKEKDVFKFSTFVREDKLDQYMIHKYHEP